MHTQSAQTWITQRGCCNANAKCQRVHACTRSMLSCYILCHKLNCSSQESCCTQYIILPLLVIRFPLALCQCSCGGFRPIPPKSAHQPPNFRPMSIVANWSTRHRASTSMYLLTFCVRFLLPERHQWKRAVQTAAIMLRTPPAGRSHYVVISRDGRKLVTRVRVMLP